MVLVDFNRFWLVLMILDGFGGFRWFWLVFCGFGWFLWFWLVLFSSGRFWMVLGGLEWSCVVLCVQSTPVKDRSGRQMLSTKNVVA